MSGSLSGISVVSRFEAIVRFTSFSDTLSAVQASEAGDSRIGEQVVSYLMAADKANLRLELKVELVLKRLNEER